MDNTGKQVQGEDLMNRVRKSRLEESGQDMRIEIIDTEIKIEAFQAEIKKLQWKIEQHKKWKIMWERVASGYGDDIVPKALREEAEIELIDTRMKIEDFQAEVEKLEKKIKSLQGSKESKEYDLKQRENFIESYFN